MWYNLVRYYYILHRATSLNDGKMIYALQIGICEENDIEFRMAQEKDYMKIAEMNKFLEEFLSVK